MAHFLVFCKAQYRFNSNYLNSGGLPQSWLLPVGARRLCIVLKTRSEFCAFSVTIVEI